MSNATSANFSAMLAQFAPNGLFKEEMVKRDYILSQIDKDDSWVASTGDSSSGTAVGTGSGIFGGPLTVRFKGAQASSQKMGGMTAQDQITQAKYVLGQILVQPETWGSLIFNHKDIMVHGKISELNFLNVLEDNLEDFMDVMKYNISTALLEGPAYCKVVALVDHLTNTTGVVLVDRPDRLHIGQKVLINLPVAEAFAGAGTQPIFAFIKEIDMNASSGGQPAGLVILCSDIGLTTPIDFTGVIQRQTADGTVLAGYALVGDLPAATTKLFMDGTLSGEAGVGAGVATQIVNQFSNLKDLLFPYNVAAGTSLGAGSQYIYGVLKSAYPYTQAIYRTGSAITATNMVKQLFAGFTHTRRFGKGRPTDIIMSYNNLAVVMAIVEASKGAFNVVANSYKTSQYGFTEVKIGSVTSQTLKFVGIQEMGDDWIAFIDWRALKFYSNGMFRKHKTPDGIEYFTTRSVAGYQYIVDIALFGDIVLERPSYCGVMGDISINYVTAFA
jgi:hypothetical protein